MTPNVYFPPDYTTAERVHIMLGDVPYPGFVFGPQEPDADQSPGVETAVLAERLPGEITGSTATSGYEAGTHFPCVWQNERHPTDGRRVLRPCSSNGELVE
jgi:hypothetical protein